MPYNKFTILILFIILVSCTSKSPSRKKNYLGNDGELYSLNGDVKQITTKPADDQPTPNPGQDYDIAYFNKQRDLYKTINGFHGMISQTHYITIHDKSRNKTATLGYFKLSDPDLNNPPILVPHLLTTLKKVRPKIDDQLLEIYRYNNHNQIISYVADPNKNADSSTYKYNENGQLIELDHYTYSKKLMDVTKFKYDDNDNLSESDQYHWTRLAIKTIYQYKKFDSHNNWILMTTHTTGIYDGSNGTNFSAKREIIYY